jgi:hypothetical protein
LDLPAWSLSFFSIQCGAKGMVLILIFVGSFFTALGIGYLAVATEQGVKKVAETEVGNKIGRWLFLLPVFDFLDHFTSEIAPDLLKKIVTVIGYLLVVGIILVALYFVGTAVLIFLFVKHLPTFVILTVLTFAIIYLVRR